MAVTAHWLAEEVIDTVNGPRKVIKLRSTLIGFHRLPGSHTGRHLSSAMLFILTRADITHLV
jgi:hypothetical protein